MLDWWLPENVSTYGQEIDWLFHLIYYITGATFVLVFVTMLAFIVMYRDRPGRRARYTHGNTPLEIAWTIVPALILVILTFLSVPAWSKIKMHVPPTDFDVNVTAQCGYNQTSGVAVGGADLFISVAGCPYYFEYTKSGTQVAAYAINFAGQQSTQDVECDDLSYSVAVFWIKDGYDGHIRAFEQPRSGACLYGGGPAGGGLPLGLP